MAAEAHTEQHPRATPENWTFPPEDGWTWDQVKELDVPFDWELVDGNIVVRGATKWWHDRVRNRLCMAMELAKQSPYGAEAERAIQFDNHNVLWPDVIVYDKTETDVRTMECTPVACVVLAVEVVSPGSLKDDRFLKPGMYAEAGIAHYWRVERGEKDDPVVHEFRRDEETGVFVPRPGLSTHTDTLVTEVPFPIEINQHDLLDT